MPYLHLKSRYQRPPNVEFVQTVTADTFMQRLLQKRIVLNTAATAVRLWIGVIVMIKAFTLGLIMGETWAVSEAQAINNVRYRTVGSTSQYLPYITSGHWEKRIEWEAELDEQGE